MPAPPSERAEIAAHQFTAPLIPGPKPGALLLTFARLTGKIWMADFGIYGCPCVNQSLPLLQMVHLIRGDIQNSLDVYQGNFHPGFGASAGSHDKGGPVDVGQFSDRHLKTQRECGWQGQHRTLAQGFDTEHNHMAPNGCDHGSPLALAQQRAWRVGRNGLLSNGPVTGPGPIGTDTPHWTEGVRAMEKEIMSFADDVAAKTVAQLSGRIASPADVLGWQGINISPTKKPARWSAAHILSWLQRSTATKDQVATLQAQVAELTTLVQALKGPQS